MIRAGVNHFNADQVQARLVLDQVQAEQEIATDASLDVCNAKDDLLAIQTLRHTPKHAGRLADSR